MGREMPHSQFSTGLADIRRSQPQHLEQSHRVERSVQRPRVDGPRGLMDLMVCGRPSDVLLISSHVTGKQQPQTHEL